MVRTWVLELALVCGLLVALIAGVLSMWDGRSFWTMAIRSGVAGLLVYAFVRIGASLFVRSILQGWAVEESEAKTKTMTKSRTQTKTQTKTQTSTQTNTQTEGPLRGWGNAAPEMKDSSPRAA